MNSFILFVGIVDSYTLVLYIGQSMLGIYNDTQRNESVYVYYNVLRYIRGVLYTQHTAINLNSTPTPHIAIETDVK